MNNRMAGVDYLRAIMSIFVVVWHIKGAGESLIFSQTKYLEHVFTVSDFVNFHLLLLAVPTFIFLSIFLYVSKGVSYGLLKRRLKRITILLTFWPIALILYKGGYQGLINIIPHSIDSFIYVILQSGYTIFYFFVCLMFCFLAAHFFAQLRINYQLFIFFSSVVLLTCLPGITKITGLYQLSAFWSPINFIPCTFLAVLVSQNLDFVLSKKNMFLLISCVLCVLFALFEWKYSVGNIFFLGQGYAIPAYTRTSLLFSVFAIVILALNPSIKTNSLIRFMSEYSLALYCLHPFLLVPIKILMSVFVQNEIILAGLTIMFVTLFSYILAMVLRRYYLKDEVVV